MSREVIGQPAAVEKIVNQIQLASTGVDDLHRHSSAQSPPMKTIFCGPSGTGKSEAGKVSHRIVFGSGLPTMLDMGQYTSDDGGNRLIGASAGYVRCEEGGALTTAIGERPHQFLVCDEAEKMHPNNWKIFLSAIEEGRITDGLGRTYYLDQTALIFTSNIGMTERGPDGQLRQRFTQEHSYSYIQEAVTQSVEDYFNAANIYELLGRIGIENVVVFDLLRPDAAEKIFDKFMATARANFQEQRGYDLIVEPEPYEALRRACCINLSFGGRGIGNQVRHLFNSALSRHLLTRSSPLSSEIRFTRWHLDDGVSILEAS